MSYSSPDTVILVGGLNETVFFSTCQNSQLVTHNSELVIIQSWHGLLYTHPKPVQIGLCSQLNCYHIIVNSFVTGSNTQYVITVTTDNLSLPLMSSLCDCGGLARLGLTLEMGRKTASLGYKLNCTPFFLFFKVLQPLLKPSRPLHWHCYVQSIHWALTVSSYIKMTQLIWMRPWPWRWCSFIIASSWPYSTNTLQNFPQYHLMF